MKNRLLFALALGATLASPQVFAQEEAPKRPWELEGEAAIVAVTGNTESQTYNLKQHAEYDVGVGLLKQEFRYLRALFGDTESAEQFAVGLRYEQKLSDTWNAFLAQNVESDVFAGYYARYNTDLGFVHAWFKTDDSEATVEGGYRLQITDPAFLGGVTSRNRGRLGASGKLRLRDGMNLSLKAEYLATLDEFADWDLNGAAAIDFVLTSVFSVKTGYELKYRAQPVILAGGVTARNADGLFTTSLVAKF
jgi:putative salt-induced outer membrane protein YdiY